MSGSAGTILIIVLFSLSVQGQGGIPGQLTELNTYSLDARPPEACTTHCSGNVGMAIFNTGIWGDPWDDHPSMDWPISTGNSYLWAGDLWSSCYGSVTAWGDSSARWASCSDYGNWELRPSEGHPLQYQIPGSIAPEETIYGVDDWLQVYNSSPYGFKAVVRNYTWDDPGFDCFVATELLITHHSEYGNPGVPLDGLLVGIRGDMDVASADITADNMDDLVYYDGHAVWCSDPQATFEYQFDGWGPASTQDSYTYMQNPDNPLPAGDPDNIYYYYNYLGPDGIPDNDVNQDGVSDHFTILAKVVGSDTLLRTDPETGIILFNAGMPSCHWNHTVGDTTYLVVPRNLSYMWDSDSQESTEDDSGEPMLSDYCNGFAGWRLLDIWVIKAGGGVERPVDVYGYPIPISHGAWNWEGDPDNDEEKYSVMWGYNQFGTGMLSGPSYMTQWLGNPNTPQASMPQNPGPFPFVCENPINVSQYPFDYRFLQSFGPMNLEDGDTLHVVGGWVVGKGLDGLRMNADLLLDAYYRDTIWGQGVAIGTGPSAIEPEELSLAPNPIRELGTVEFTLNSPGITEVQIYNLSGRVVSVINNCHMEAGRHSAVIDGSDLECGVYFLQVNRGSSIETARFVILD